MKKFVRVGIVIILVLSFVFVGCSQENHEEAGQKPSQESEAPDASKDEVADKKESSNVTEPGTFPIVKEKETISIMIPTVDTEHDINENLLTKEMEEKTNIQIEWNEVSSEFREKVNLMFASNEYVDMVITGAGTVNRMDKAMEAQLGTQGLILPLNDLIEEQSIWFKKALEEYSELEDFITTPDGNIYALPQIDDGLHMIFPQKMWINTTWLDNLGLDMPETTDEFYDVLKAFKEQDPNQNGEDDEIPLSTCKEGANVRLDGFLMNPFIYSPGKDRMWVRDGEVILSAIEPEYKEGLKYLNKLYSEGLIYPESFTQDQTTQVNLNEHGDTPVIGAFPSMHLGYACSLSASDKWHQYQPLLPLKDSSGERLAENDLYAKYTTGFAVITKGCENPEAAFRLLDYFFSEEGTYRTLLGREGKEWVKAGPEDKNYRGEPAKFKKLDVDTDDPEYQNINWGQSFPTYRSAEGFYLDQAYPENPYDPGVPPGTGQEALLLRKSYEHQKFAQKPENVLPPLYYSQEDAEEFARLKTTINDYIEESVVKFITGDVNIDEGWDKYIQELKNIGLEDYLRIIQDAYDKSYK